MNIKIIRVTFFGKKHFYIPRSNFVTLSSYIKNIFT